MHAFFRSLLASIVGFFICILLIFFIFAAIASTSKKKVSVKENSVLVLKLNTVIPERPADNPLENIPVLSDDLDFPVSLKEILENIQYAKSDNNIKGIYLEFNLIQGGLSTIDEIRNALVDFKKSGKFVYAYSENYTQKSYYLASVADSVFLNPNGIFSFAGFHSEQMFLKGALDKLDIKPILIRAGKYKSAGEMFTETSMSDANREQVSSFINSFYGYYLDQVDKARNTPADELRNIATNLDIKFPADAVKHKLVDRLVYEDEVLNALKNKLGAKSAKDIHEISLKEYNQAEHPVKNSGGNRIAVIYAVGEINGGEGSETKIGSDKLSKTIRDAANDDDVKAIVLRVNSPGGSALASDVIWREVILARNKKPVIASFGDVAASGGYYIAAPAEYIFAEPTSITGSIGVFGLLADMQGFWKEKLGITWDRVTTGKHSDIGNPNRPMTEEEKGIIQSLINNTYAEFKNRVATGRKLKPEFVDSIAQGRVYSGIQAKNLGLVDGLGNLDDAIAMAAKKANLTQYSIKVLPSFNNGIFKMFNQMNLVKSSMISDEIGSQNYEILRKAASVKDMQGILTYYPFDLNIY